MDPDRGGPDPALNRVFRFGGGDPVPDNTVEGRRRNALATLSAMAGLAALVAAANVLVVAGTVEAVAGLAGLAAGAFAFGALVARGRFPSLVADDQLLWRLLEP